VKTYQDIITEARVLLQDDDAVAYRFSNTILIAMLNRALQALGRLRPDAFYDLYDNNSINVPEVIESGAGAGQVNWDTAFGLEMQFYNPLVHYTVGMAELTDDEYTEDGRALLLLNQFKQNLVGL
jgi:hypothetical protein